ncbi:Transcription factor CBF/NF-Y/archaeal histone [Macleaya cordata]|uniref:Transcription factor CBF/NF-Y/archaeal histone n=1 Tax=Macleaya cordata TaxID=56857 RepID=A0A200R145_MACCD|nr:Transcription factor CBF/NF-Y/archaeal histone [Macleaya cordata]
MENNNKQQPPQSSSYPPQQPSFHHLMQQQQQKVQMFLSYQRQEIEQINDFKNHQLPLARIKKIMKADEDVRMISAEAPILFSKACELFILELTIRSWLHAEENKRRTLQKNDISAAITRTDIFDFLVDIVPRDEFKEEAARGVTIGRPALPGIDQGVYVHQPSQAWQSVWQTDDGSYGSGGGDDHGNLDGIGYVEHNPSESL